MGRGESYKAIKLCSSILIVPLHFLSLIAFIHIKFLILVPFNFIDVDEINANVDKKLKLSNF